MDSAVMCPVPKLEKLLLATEGSGFSEGAVREAIKFAAQCSSRLYAMSVVEVLTDYETFSPQKIEDALEAGVKSHLESVKARAQKEGVDCETIIAYGEPHQSIVEEAEKRKVDVIVLGRRGTKGLKKLLIGEVAAKVIGHAPCNVLVAAAELAMGIAKRCGSRVMALSSIRSNDELGQQNQM